MNDALLPGMAVAASPAFSVVRAAPNLWWAVFAAEPFSADKLSGAVGVMPSALLQREGPSVTLAKVELDACGTWVTLTNDEPARPVVVRRAGWVDVRGHPTDGPLLDDRVGLGPGDCLVLARGAALEALIDALLDAPCEPSALTTAAQRAGATSAAVLAVPGELGEDPRQRVADATGIALEQLELPGYPLGDLQPELWAVPPRPPRLARLRLLPDHRSVRDVRALLDRLIASWRLTDRVNEEALKLAASEVATNAIMHSRAPESVTVRYLGDAVRIEVDDNSDTVPVVRESTEDEIGGRGLHVVDSVSSKWGVEARDVGKRVWFEVEVDTAG